MVACRLRHIGPPEKCGQVGLREQELLLWSMKYLSILVSFLIAFLCNVLSIRYNAYASTLPTVVDKESLDYAARSLNRGELLQVQSG
ncbi:hypothetical protein MLD38_026225 [Melastoma candidum]|uniref:Uncharacterized protein n=1 Tax=Melastoma candidum TaxID=119954 RepID=A0ACB9NZH6_9MYRT|nr:hypothetical protein MLD38_026225 [Melastoma candidum]